MKKKESTLVNMVVVLLIITLVSGLSLGYVNDLTLEPKARARLAKKVKALNMVLPEYTNDPINEVMRVASATASDSIEIYPAFDEKGFAGAAVTGRSEKGYSGPVKIMVGFLPDGRIGDIAVLEQKETPGLGTKMKEEAFLKQFRDKDPLTFKLKVKKDGGDVDALAGATISTRAFTEGATEAFEAFREFKATHVNTEN